MEEDEPLLVTPIERAGNRPVLFLGGDRKLTMFLSMGCAILVFTFPSWLDFALALLLWFVMLFFFRAIAKADPLMVPVYFRSKLYPAYSPARSTPRAPSYPQFK